MCERGNNVQRARPPPFQPLIMATSHETENQHQRTTSCNKSICDTAKTEVNLGWCRVTSTGPARLMTAMLTYMISFRLCEHRLQYNVD